MVFVVPGLAILPEPGAKFYQDSLPLVKIVGAALCHEVAATRQPGKLSFLYGGDLATGLRKKSHGQNREDDGKGNHRKRPRLTKG
jgi:hypothetical protein